jgi:hypothetical protein
MSTNTGLNDADEPRKQALNPGLSSRIPISALSISGVLHSKMNIIHQ